MKSPTKVPNWYLKMPDENSSRLCWEQENLNLELSKR